MRIPVRGLSIDNLYIMLSEGVKKMPEMTVLAKRIKEARRSHNMDQFEFSAEIGISREEISLLELEKTDPKLSTLQKITAYMGITVSQLLEIENETF